MLEILYEDEHCLAVAKPAGLSTQAPPIAGPTLETAVRRHLDPTGQGGAFVLAEQVFAAHRPPSPYQRTCHPASSQPGTRPDQSALRPAPLFPW